MIEIRLKHGKTAIVDDCDAHLAEFKWYPFRVRSTDNGNFYACRKEFKMKCVFLHHAVIGRPLNRKLFVDHINGNGLDNRRANLRVFSNRENQQNQKLHRSGKLVGATYQKSSKKWISSANINGKKVYLGTFDTPEKASLAYRDALSAIPKP